MGVPYRWGGNCSLNGLDCSAFVCDVLRMVGVVGLKADYSAQGLYNHLLSRPGSIVDTSCPRGSILFFGRNENEITHTAMVIFPKTMIEAGGGGPQCKTVTDAIALNATVRQAPIMSRSNLVSCILPKYE